PGRGDAVRARQLAVDAAPARVNLDHSTAMWCGGPCYPPTTSVHWFSVLNPDRTPRLAYTELSNLLHRIAPTPTPIAPSRVTQTVSFDDLSPANRPLNGQYPSGVIDWGTNTWYLSAPWRQFTTNSITFNFNGATQTSGSLRFVNPRRLVQLDAFNGGSN